MFNNIKNGNDLLSNDIQEMLRLHLGDTVEIKFDENLSVDQQKAFDLFKDNKNILIIGPAGTGKSKIIKTIYEYNKVEKNKQMYLTSTTGISAYNISGITIHSLLGIGTGELEIDALIRKVARKKMYRERIINMEILVVDESSMLSADLFEKLNLLCQNIRRNKLFFGGIQVIFSMDPMQLLPVFNKNKELYKNVDERLIVESVIFNKYFKKDNIIILKENFRQKSDPVFINLLGRIRDGTFTEKDIELLNTRKTIPKNESEHVHLVTSNKKAQIINENELKKLKGKSIKYTSAFNSCGNDKEIEEILLKELQFQFKQKGIVDLELKNGCRVMLIKNIDIESGLVNGALGTIIDFVEDSATNQLVPIVQFDSGNETEGIKQIISNVSWELEIDDCKVTALQIPLMLAYSITCHKSQSLTLDSAVLDLSDAFCDHMIYVALSRLRSLDTMYLKSFNPKKITINKVMKKFLESLN
jgi:ATP-dependent DNA helicase PIF1